MNTNTKQGALNKAQEKEARAQLAQLLISLPEDRIGAGYTDARFDREHEKFMLLGGREISLHEVNEIKKTIAKTLQDYQPTFREEFYVQTFRLHGWPIPDGGIVDKPHVCARYTNEIIYARFPKEVLPMLQHLNPFVEMGLRMHKHFQWLNPEARVSLLGFIEQAIETMKTCTGWYEFRVKYAKQYGLSFQLRLDLK